MATAAVALTLIVLQLYINPYNLNVDRWSAIHNWCDYLLAGKYPYAAQTHLGGYGSPFPVWQIFHLPFYFLGDVGLSFAVVLCIFVYAIYKYAGSGCAFKALALLAISPAWIYEVAVRSDLLTNFLLLTAIIILFFHYRVNLSNHFWLVAVTCGLFMSTRLSTLLPFCLLYFKEWWNLRFTKKVLFIVAVAAVFLLTFMPFILWNKDMLLFFEYNPFILQSRQGNPIDFVIFIPLGLILAFYWKNNIRKYAISTAFLIIIFIFISFLHASIENGNYDWFSQRYDITYFSMSLPFIILALLTDNQKSIDDNQ